MLEIGTIRFKTFDLGGHEIARKIWQEYTASADGIVYLVDIADRSRFNESFMAMKDILDIKEFKAFPILILANKVDLPQAASMDEVARAL